MKSTARLSLSLARTPAKFEQMEFRCRFIPGRNQGYVVLLIHSWAMEGDQEVSLFLDYMSGAQSSHALYILRPQINKSGGGENNNSVPLDTDAYYGSQRIII